jgi:hypothetical protein
MYFHVERPPKMCPSPKVRRPPKVLKIPLKVIQIQARAICSSLVHQIPVIATKPGEIVDSKTPKKNRAVAKPPKELQEAVIINILDQIMMLAPRNLANGSFCINRSPGYSKKR